MASVLTKRIIQVVADATGVKSGVDVAEREFRRLESAATNAARTIDRELKKANVQVNTGTSGSASGAATGRRNLSQPAYSIDPSAARIGRADINNFQNELAQTRERVQSLNRIFKVYEDAIGKAAGDVRNSAASERALKAKRDDLARRIAVAASNQDLALGGRLRAAGGSGADSPGSGFRLSGAFNRDPADGADLLGKIIGTSSPSSGAAAKLEREQEELGKTIADRQAEERRLRAIARSLGVKEDLTGKSLDELRAAIASETRSIRDLNQKRASIASDLASQKSQEIQSAFDKSQQVLTGLNRQRLAENQKSASVSASLANQKRQEIQSEFDRAQQVRDGLNRQRQAENQQLVSVPASLAAQKQQEIQEESDRAQRVLAGLNNQREQERQQNIAGYSKRQQIEASLARQKQEELAQARTDSERAVRVAQSLAAQKQAEKQAAIRESLRNQRVREEAFDAIQAENVRSGKVASSLLSQRAAALQDPKNLAAQNRYERSRGQPLSRALAPERDPFSVRATASIGEFSQGLTTKATGLITGSFRKVGSFMVSEFTSFVSRVAANLTSRLIAGAVEGIGTLAVTAVQAASRFEDALVSFGVLAGGKERGAALVDELQKLAIDTPFKLQEVLDESKLLLSYGVSVDDLSMRLRQLGDVSSGTGADLGRLSLAFGQVLAKGRLQGPEIRQFTEAGVGVRDFVNAFNEDRGGLGQERKVSTAGFFGLVEQGEVSSKIIERAFDRMTGAGGRFFGFMEVRSKTVSGRFNALSESLEIIAQKIGKSLFDRLGVGTGIDSLVKKLQGIDFNAIDKVIAEYAAPVQRFVVQVFSGAEAIFRDVGQRLFGSLDVKTFSDGLSKIAEEVIPAIIDGAQTLVQVILSIGQAAGRFAQAAEILVNSLSPGKGGLGNTATGILAGGLLAKLAVGIAGATLTATGVGSPLGLALLGGAVGLGTFGIAKATGADLFGRSSRNGNETNATERFTVALGEAAKRLEEFKPADLFQRKAKEKAQFEIKEALDKDLARRQRIANAVNRNTGEDTAGVNAILGAPIDGNPFKRRPLDLVPDRNGLRVRGIEDSIEQSNKALDEDIARAKREIANIRLLDGGPNISEERKIVNSILGQVKGLGIGKFDVGVDSFAQLDKFSAAIKARTATEGASAIAGVRGGVNAEDIRKIENYAVQLGTAFQNLENKIIGLGDDTIPQFRKRLEDINADVSKGKFDPVGDFKKDLGAIDFLSSPLARFAGIGLTKEEADIARSERVKRFTEQFKPVEIKPAPLVRAASQEAEQALTKAIYESRNVLSAEQQLNTALELARKATDDNTKQLKENNEAVKGKKEISPFGEVVLAAFGL